MSVTEYRVVWQREGRRRQTAIFQSWTSACRKMQGILATDQAKIGTRMETLPDLVGPPVLEVRECSPWEANAYQPYGEPAEHVVREMRWHFGGELETPTTEDSAEVPF